MKNQPPALSVDALPVEASVRFSSGRALRIAPVIRDGQSHVSFVYLAAPESADAIRSATSQLRGAAFRHGSEFKREGINVAVYHSPVQMRLSLALVERDAGRLSRSERRRARTLDAVLKLCRRAGYFQPFLGRMVLGYLAKRRRDPFRLQITGRSCQPVIIAGHVNVIPVLLIDSYGLLLAGEPEPTISSNSRILDLLSPLVGPEVSVL